MDHRFKAFPAEFTARLQKIIPPGILKSVLEGYSNEKPQTFRINTLKISEEDALKQLFRFKIETEKDRHIPNCYYFKKISDKKIRELDLYAKGKIYLQNFSSQVPPLILNPQPGETVLDLCASPGSKTTQMAALMNNLGKLIALEPDDIRYQRLCHNVELMGASVVQTSKQRGESFLNQNKLRPDPIAFDKILVDAPCSGEGTFQVNHRASFGHWSLDFIGKIAKLQKKLLLAATLALKPEGVILYSTCSLAPEENEAVVDAVLKENPQMKSLPIAKISGFKFFQKPLDSWAGQIFDERLKNACRIYPSAAAEGFFLCLLRKE